MWILNDSSEKGEGYYELAIATSAFGYFLKIY